MGGRPEPPRHDSFMLSARLVITLLLPVLLPLGATPYAATPVARAVRTPAPLKIDGRLDEPTWKEAPVIASFTQRDPLEGQPGSSPTTVRVLYDNDAIYIGARIEDRAPVTLRLGRRDMDLSSSDWFRVSLDTFHDRRNAVRFEVNPAGVKRDGTISGDTFRARGQSQGSRGSSSRADLQFTGHDGELAWDAIWDAATSVDQEGWTAEIRIPFSQLRFARSGASSAATEEIGEGDAGPNSGSLPPANEQVWGVQFETINAGRQELAMFSYASKREAGGVAAFGDLRGLENLRSNRPLEVIPYVLGQATFDATGSNPLVPERDQELKAGVDVRYRITSNLTLTASINPDFGQVEVDPAIINLTAFETRLEEKRPFFVEGASIFVLAPNLTSRNAARELLYSRRIGRAPQVDLPSEVSHAPASTNIIAAAKVTGRTEGGWTVGLLDALTDKMHGSYLDAQGDRRSALVQPRANYLVGRVSRESRGGQTAIGAIATAVNRDLDDPRAAAVLTKSAYTGGLDLGVDLLERVWNVSTYFAGSQVRGTPEAIKSLQRAPSRYYQRPDAESFRLDTNATSLSGTSGQIQVIKQTGKHWSGNAAYVFVSPGYEINDVGFHQRVDRRGFSGRFTYSERTPGAFLRTSNIAVYPNLFQNNDGDWLDKNLRIRSNLQHLNYWTLELGGEYSTERMDDRLTRGGPVARKPKGWALGATLNSDARKPVRGGFTVSTESDESGMQSEGAALKFDLQTASRWSISLSPHLDRTRQEAQYVTSVADATATATYGRRYIFARLHQTEASLETRFNYAFTANLTLELYAQALVANGRYGAPKEFLRPREFRFATYGRDAGVISKSGARYTIDPDGSGPATPFSVQDLTFTERTLQANAVLRWEFRAGSTLYLVWQQQRLNPLLMENFAAGRATRSVFDAPARNIFAVKMSYWFNP